MAGLARARIVQRLVVGALGGLEVPQVAAQAVRRKACELRPGSAGVARFALRSGMCTDQRKAVLMILYVFDRDRLPLDGMALLAAPAELPAVDVRMAGRTRSAHVAEDHADVALRATDGLVHPAQREPRLAVVKFGDGAYRFEAGESVAILTGHSQRTSGLLALLKERVRMGCTLSPELQQDE